MMINKRLLHTVKESKKFIAANVILQWCSLATNIIMMTAITGFFSALYYKQNITTWFWCTGIIVLCGFLIRYFCSIGTSRMSYLSSKSVKKTLRSKIYQKLLRLGPSYQEQTKTSEIVQVAVEGVEQLETYFGSYLPQFFYAMLAPVTLFGYLCFVNFPAAIVLLVCVPMIPISIAAVQTWAKKLLAKYWGQYTALGDTFLENLQGLTTLKIYQSDQFKQDEMNQESEKFRKITMKVLTMQLNSITIMDFIAYGGAALGIILAVTQFQSGNVSLSGCLLILLLAADFFLPMRQLGSFFHIAMNGMAASNKIFHLLDLPEPQPKSADFPKNETITCHSLRFSYESQREILHGIDLDFPVNQVTAIVGASGCGKSTLSAILTGRNKGYLGSVKIGTTELSTIHEEELQKNVTYVSHQSYLFKGTVGENLRMGAPLATDDELWQVLQQVNLAAFLKEADGLETQLTEKGSNFSGGQRQRLALARALLHNSPVYVFDEATSNIDAESEADILREIYHLAKSKTVILISHRLANVQNADQIYVMESGRIAEVGTHQLLLAKNGIYGQLWNTQQSLENYGKRG